ncbi:MAG: nucleotidyltransferase domain-containing protein [Clostridiales bacterium]|nr:nucleotidyltransferase domain-containing protein [Lachnospiraceae bacterium]MCD7921023.1 nucleotidyltransferase domain-containing protein [Clostridiales bacterium]MCD8109409.1 nucleotidyltransferase domain-containing protein [Clostridiales bacterium]MCD8132298.1 nucleotidyltransferase domain-containing protein [Clostridiales bacterium]
MKKNIPERVVRDIVRFAKCHDIGKVVLFGSRARGDHTERSDVDLAVCGGDFEGFYWDVKEKTHSLLMFDIVDLNKNISEEFRNEIEREGILIYEKA